MIKLNVIEDDPSQGLYTGIMRADAKVFDPTGGAVSPIVYANLHE